MIAWQGYKAGKGTGKKGPNGSGRGVLRKEGNVYVLDLFVKVPSVAVAPINYKSMEVFGRQEE